jgi:hypothetical protein
MMPDLEGEIDTRPLVTLDSLCYLIITNIYNNCPCMRSHSYVRYFGRYCSYGQNYQSSLPIVCLILLTI